MKNRYSVLKYILCLVISVACCSVTKAQNGIEALRAKLNRTVNDSGRTIIYGKIYDFYNYSNPDSARVYLDAGVAEFVRKNYKFGIGYMYSLKGAHDASHGRGASGKKMLHEALAIFHQLNSATGIGYAENLLGTIDGRAGNFDSATKHFIKALEAHNVAADADGIANVYINLGNIADQTGNFEKALYYYNKGVEVIKDKSINRTLCNLYNNLGIVYGKKGDLKSALDYFEKALAASNQEEYVDVYLYSLLNIGILYKIAGKPDKALEKLNEALAIANDKKLPEEAIRLITNIAAVKGINAPEEAVSDLKDALSKARTLGQKQLVSDIYFELTEIYRRTKQYEALANVLEDQKAVSDSLYEIDKVREVANLESVYELEQSQSHLKELTLESQSNQLKRNILGVVSGSLILMLAIVVFFLIRTRKLNEELRRQKLNLSISNETKDKLFSIIGHDLRGPVNNIPVVMELLDDPEMLPKDKIFLTESVKQQAVSISRTLETLLFWGQSHIKGSNVTQEYFNTRPLVQKNIELMQITAAQKQLKVVDHSAIDCRVYGVSDHFDFIIRNLLSNAFKFTPPNGTVTVKSDAVSQPGFVVFSVQDTGTGINKVREAAIFKPNNASASGTAGESGSGIGLVLCKEFVVENRGDIWFQTEVGVGTTFYFTFKTGV